MAVSTNISGSSQITKQSEINQLYPGANYVSYTAGLTAAIFALHLPKIKERGVFPPEALSSEIRSSIIQELEKIKSKLKLTRLIKMKNPDKCRGYKIYAPYGTQIFLI